MKSSHWGADGGDGGGGLGYRRGPQSVQSAEGGCKGGDCQGRGELRDEWWHWWSEEEGAGGECGG